MIYNFATKLSRATIIKYNDNGSVRIGIDGSSGVGAPEEYDANLPLSWIGFNGEIMAGYPEIGAPVIVSRGHGGEWFVTGYYIPDNVFNANNIDDKLADFKPGNILLQTRKTKGTYSKIFLSPTDGIVIGDSQNFNQTDPIRGINSVKTNEQLTFLDSKRKISGSIKRDRNTNSLRNIVSSSLTSHNYSDSLSVVGMDPTSAPAYVNGGFSIRNLPLIEDRELVYEFAFKDGIEFLTDESEFSGYKNKLTPIESLSSSRRNTRADAFSLSLEHPNHLMEVVKGTGVDATGNVIDLNRHKLPFGSEENLSFGKTSDISETFKKLRDLHRKSLAYHWELNARKDINPPNISTPPRADLLKGDVNYDMGRHKSRFFIDIDKEGQFKINIPSSSETGNVPLLTRTETASVRFAALNKDRSANEIIKDESGLDLFLENFANAAPITIENKNQPKDYFTDEPIKLGTAHHDISNTCLQFQDTGRSSLINYMPNSRLNNLDFVDNIITDTIITEGESANAGGRSGMINLDGFISINIGANTIDRQSMWADYAGGIVTNVGRDLRGRSYVGNYDGDVLIQIGGSSIGNGVDSRFDGVNDASRQGVFDLRIVHGASGQLSVLRFDDLGVILTTYGRMDFESAQDITIKSRGAFKIEAEEIILFHESGLRRRVLRNGTEI